MRTNFGAGLGLLGLGGEEGFVAVALEFVRLVRKVSIGSVRCTGRERCKFIIQFLHRLVRLWSGLGCGGRRHNAVIPLAVWWAAQRPTAQTELITGNPWSFPNRVIGAIGPYPPYTQFPASRR